jgi:hypothetical protein
VNHLTLDQLATFANKWLGLHPAYRKYGVCVAGVIGQIVDLGVFHGAVQHDLSVILAVATAFGVRQVANAS